MTPICTLWQNSENHDEMPHDAAFNQGLHCLLRQIQSSEKYNLLENFNLRILDIYNGQSQVYFINNPLHYKGLSKNMQHTTSADFFLFLKVKRLMVLDGKVKEFTGKT